MEDRKECPLCKSLVSKYAFSRHIKSCTSDASKFKGGESKEVKYKSIFTGFCIFCGKKCKNFNSQRNHERLCKKNPDKQVLSSRKGKCNGHYGKKGENQFTKAKKLGLPCPIVSEETRKKFSKKSKGRKHSNETKEHLSLVQSKYIEEKGNGGFLNIL